MNSFAYLPSSEVTVFVCQELEKMQLKHQEELGKRLKMNINTEKKLIKEVSQVKLSLQDHLCCQNFLSFVYTFNTQCVCVKVA